MENKDLYKVVDDRLKVNLFQNNHLNGYETMTFFDALNIILKQMEVANYRERTLFDYRKWSSNYAETQNICTLDQITLNSIYEWLYAMQVADTTRLIRFKSLSAVLGKFVDNGWLSHKFWRTIKIRIDKDVKEGATENDVLCLLSIMDLTNFFELRDACAIYLLYETGIRLSTLTNLEEKHLNLEKQLINLSPDIMKNRKSLSLPINENLCNLLTVLIQHNKRIRRQTKRHNQYVFITRNGTNIQRTMNNNVLQKRISRYAKEMNINNINPHSLRRGFAQKLLRNGADIVLISKALGHSDLAVTTQYLNMSKEEIIEGVRKYK